MWRSKKFILVVLLVVVVAAGIGGAVLAADNGDGSQLETQRQAFIDRVLEIYEEQTGVVIDQEVLRDAFAQAKSEQLDEALQNRLDSLVEQGEITQQQADEFLEWWQSRPDIQLGPGPRAGIPFIGIGRMCIR
jgi:hypothetical protein